MLTGHFTIWVMAPNFRFSFGAGVAPIWAHILHSLWHVTSCKMALEARIGFIWASPITPLHQTTPPILCFPRISPRHGLPNWCNFISLHAPMPPIPTSPRHGLTLGRSYWPTPRCNWAAADRCHVPPLIPIPSSLFSAPYWCSTPAPPRSSWFSPGSETQPPL